MIITKQNILESDITSLTFNANIMKDADGNHIADVMDQAFKTQASSDDGYILVDGKRQTETEFFVQKDGWFVRVEYAHKTTGEKVVQQADLMFSILEEDLFSLAKTDPKFASGVTFTFDVANFPDFVDAQANVQAATPELTRAEKRAAKRAARQAEKNKSEPALLEEPVLLNEPAVAPLAEAAVLPEGSTPPATVLTPVPVLAAAPAPIVRTAPRPTVTTAVVPVGAGLPPVPAVVAVLPPAAPLTLNDIITHELEGDFATYGRSVGNFNLSATESLITPALLADLQDGDKQAHAKSSTRLIGQGKYSAFGAMLIPASKASAVATSLQQLRQKSYHTYHYECFTDNGWQYRTKGYGMGITIARETTTAKKVTGGILFKPGSPEVVVAHPEAASKDYCTAEDFSGATPFYAVWNMTNELLTINGVEYKVLMGVMSADDARATERDKVLGYIEEAMEHA